MQETRGMEAHARVNYQRLGASQNLKTIYFDEAGGNHDFPSHVREQAYSFLDASLKKS